MSLLLDAWYGLFIAHSKPTQANACDGFLCPCGNKPVAFSHFQTQKPTELQAPHSLLQFEQWLRSSSAKSLGLSHVVCLDMAPLLGSTADYDSLIVNETRHEVE